MLRTSNTSFTSSKTFSRTPELLPELVKPSKEPFTFIMALVTIIKLITGCNTLLGAAGSKHSQRGSHPLFSVDGYNHSLILGFLKDGRQSSSSHSSSVYGRSTTTKKCRHLLFLFSLYMIGLSQYVQLQQQVCTVSRVLFNVFQ